VFQLSLLVDSKSKLLRQEARHLSNCRLDFGATPCGSKSQQFSISTIRNFDFLPPPADVWVVIPIPIKYKALLAIINNVSKYPSSTVFVRVYLQQTRQSDSQFNLNGVEG
jgi:hypothetical protein